MILGNNKKKTHSYRKEKCNETLEKAYTIEKQKKKKLTKKFVLYNTLEKVVNNNDHFTFITRKTKKLEQIV